MKKFYQNLSLVFIFLTLLASSTFAQYREKCGTQKWLEAAFRDHPELKIQYEEREKKMGEAINDRLSRHLPASPFTVPVVIPIVFHVVLTAGQQTSITDAKVLAQLATLNKDYGGINPDSANVPPQFQAVRGHSMVSFCLAQRKPDGTATTGIDRVNSSTTSDGSNNDPVKSTAAGGASVWDPTKYVNVWLCNFDDATLLGYATFPIGSPEGGAPASQQGVVVLAQSIPGGSAAPYNLGRTLTHELGHFFWLRHVWGDGAGCAADFPNTTALDDTPKQSDPTFGCEAQAPNVGFLDAGCTGSPNPPGRMFQNFMDYTDDGCMTMFTIGQDARIEQAINMYRPTLIVNNLGCVPPSSANGFTFNSVLPTTVACGTSTASITLGTAVTGTFTTPITLTASGNPAGTTVSFVPNPLTPGSSTVVTLSNVNTLVPGTYSITVTGVAGAVTQTSTLAYTVTANPPGITTEPADVTTCAGTNAAFNVSAFGAGLSYQWQVSTGGGPFTSIGGAVTPTYNIPSVTLAQNGNKYRAIITSACGSSTSDTALLTVTTATTITTQPVAAVTVCAGVDTTLKVVVAGSDLAYQWQVSITGCAGTFTNIPGATAATLSLSGITAVQNGYGYRVVITSSCTPSTITSNCTTLTVSGTAPSITSQPAPVTVCAGAAANFTVTVSPLTGISYQWQISIGGGPFNAISGATGAIYNIAATTVAQNGNQYQVVITTTCGTITSAPVLLTVNPSTSIVTNLPTSVTVCAGADTTFTVQASGGNLSYHWQVSSTGCGGTFSDIPGAFGPSYTLTGITAAFDGYAYQVLVIGNCPPNSITSNCVALTVSGSAPSITAQPVPVTVCEGTAASFTVTVTPTTGVTYQWQVSTDGGLTFTNIAGATTSTYNIPATTAANNGSQYQVVLTSTCGTSTTIPALLTVNAATAITTDLPAAISLCSGADNTFTVAASGSNTYQWQVSTTGCGGTFTNITGATSASYTLAGVTIAQNGYAYQVVITGTCPGGSITSNCTTLTVSTSVGITAQPTDVTACSGSDATFTVTASGTGVNYQWQVSTDNGVTFTNIPGATGSTLTVPAVTAADDSHQYLAILTNSSCVTGTVSDTATLTVNDVPTVTTSPLNASVCAGSNATFTASASGTNITYQWQVSLDGGITFTNISGATSNTLIVPAVTSTLNNNQYQVIVSGACTPAATSSAATLTVASPVGITTQPVAPGAACAGATLIISVAGDGGGGTLTYQWQVSTDGGTTFTNISGETNPDLVLINVDASMDGNQYQVILSNGACPANATSIPVTIAVNPSPSVILTASPSSTVLLPGQTVTLTATVTPPGSYTFTWEQDGVALANTTETLTVTSAAADTGAYTVTASNAGGCSGRSNTINVSDSANAHFYIYPNPNDGQFTVAYPNPGGIPTQRMVMVFDSHGARVFTKALALVQSFELIHIDLRPAASGVYIVVFYDGAGTRLASEKVVVRH